VNLAVRDTEVLSDATPEPGPADADAEAIAARAVARDPAAWEFIFEQHYRSVFSYVRYRLRALDEAEDIASQVFEVAYSRADRFDYRGVPIEGWLIGIARNLVPRPHQKLSRRGFDAELDESVELTEPTVPTPLISTRDLLAARWAPSTDDQQEVLRLRFLLDRSVAETALLMDRSEDAVKNLQRRALAAMHKALASADYPMDGMR